MNFELESGTINWNPGRLVIAGYTAKDQDSAYKHIEELKELGVPAPPTIPMLYHVSLHLLTTDNLIHVVGSQTSGEAEAVLLHADGRWYLGLGSDHTDRVLEATSVHKSKQICQKPVSSRVWHLEEVEDYWDELEMKSWITVNGEERGYQAGLLGEFMNPQELVDVVRKRDFYDANIALFCGTPPLLTGEFVYGESFRAELVDTRKNRRITLSYQIRQVKEAAANLG